MLSRSLLLATLVVSAVNAAPEYPKMGADVYDPHASGTELIQFALLRAGLQHKHVLVVLGANWCIWCHRLHQTLTSDPEVAPLLQRDFEVVMVDVNTRHGVARNADVDAKYGKPTRLGLP